MADEDPKPARLLVVEDDAHIREGLVDMLEDEGYEIFAVGDGEAAIRSFAERSPDLILLDVMMPRMNGYDVCREIRERDRQVPVIMLTAKSEEIDKVLGLELGADDYITKPFGVRELLARVAAALRRSRLSFQEAARLPEILKFGAAEVHVGRFEVTVAGVTKRLTERELTLMRLFRARPGEVLSRDYLLDQAWGVRYRGTTRTLDQHIVQLRKKIELNPSTPRCIVTVHGVGYRYCEGGET